MRGEVQVAMGGNALGDWCPDPKFVCVFVRHTSCPRVLPVGESGQGVRVAVAWRCCGFDFSCIRMQAKAGLCAV